tara:strand:- start:5650 stop:6042 length:393 start_codon:yes stop_codon:yes gene_type:complete
MKKIIKNIGIIISGIIIGMIINMGLIIIGERIFPLTDNFDAMNAINWDIKYFIFPFLAHSIGTLIGSFAVSRISRNSNIVLPILIGVWFLFGGIIMAAILPAPIWFILIDIIICYIPMSFLGWKISKLSK